MRIGFALVVTLVFILSLTADGTESSAQGNGFTFTTVGDLGGTTNTDSVLSGISTAEANFQLTLGDLSYGSYAPESAWCSYVSSKVGGTFPFELGAGNHDSDGTGQGHISNLVTCLPDRIGNLTGTYGREYYFDYQNLARFIYISPNLTLDGQAYTYTIGSARYNWLASAIDSARAANLPWVVVAMHKNCISTGVKSCEIGSDLFNLLVSKKVDLVLQAHDHNYQRSKQLGLTASCTAIVPTVFDPNCVHDDGADRHYPKGGGMVLAIVGTGGASLYPSNHLDSEAGYFARFFHPVNDVPSYGFLQVNVSATTLSARFVTTSIGATFSDSFTVSSGPPPPTPTAVPTPQTTTLIAKNSTWKYLDNGSNLGTVWRAPAFDDTGWKAGSGQLGYGDGDEATTVGFGPDANNKYITTYFRKTFNVSNPSLISALTLKILRDDGAVVYLNGTQVASSNMPASFSYNTYASATVGGVNESVYVPFQVNPALLRRAETGHERINGTNVLAVEIHQVNGTSSDVSFDLELIGTRAPTTTTLASFIAQLNLRGRVRVKWVTANEMDVVGFNVWRSLYKRTGWKKITLEPLAAKYSGTAQGARYRLTDRDVTTDSKYFYKLEILHADQPAEWSSPVKVKVP